MKVLLVVLVVALAVYLAVRLMQERGLPGQGGRPATPRRRGPNSPGLPRLKKSPPPRQVAPDDDEEFLRDLDRKRLDPPGD
ncbi:hypothetical protein FXB39_04100 [Nocardioides sp. BGMRC 2183]|nr:hypothetical protein FXB39_04100 [Nocardioides sp. BGMRC 2183]